MDFLQPRSVAEAVDAARSRPDAVPIHGGTDVMVDINFGRLRPPALLDLTQVPELSTWEMAGGLLRVGAGVPYTRLITELGTLLPGLALASRTVGSPQIRNRGTLGGNLGSASPAGDTLPVLLASGAVVEAASAGGTRQIPARDFFTGVKRHALRPGELITGVLLPPAPGPQQFCKVGTRNAMVIAVASFALELDPARHRVGTGIGSAAPTPRRAPAAEEFLAGVLTERGLWDQPGELEDAVGDRFAALVAAAADPIDDVRGTSRYRTHALKVMARRALRWAWHDYTGGHWRQPQQPGQPEERAG
jgi:CO/xanthine dehydrogenase FAD-binding subunit